MKAFLGRVSVVRSLSVAIIWLKKSFGAYQGGARIAENRQRGGEGLPHAGDPGDMEEPASAAGGTDETLAGSIIASQQREPGTSRSPRLQGSLLSVSAGALLGAVVLVGGLGWDNVGNSGERGPQQKEVSEVVNTSRDHASSESLSGAMVGGQDPILRTRVEAPIPVEISPVTESTAPSEAGEGTSLLPTTPSRATAKASGGADKAPAPPSEGKQAREVGVDDTMVSSWYGPGFNGEVTASGDIFHSWEYTAAHKSVPLGTKLMVSYGGESVVVEVTDRGPYIAGRDLDLSRAAAERIGLTYAGEGVVEVEAASSDTSAGPYHGG